MGSCFSSEGGGSKRKARAVTSQIPRAGHAESIVPVEPSEPPVIPGLVLCMLLDGPPPSPSFVLAPTSGNVAPVLGLFFGSVLRFDFAAC